MYIYDELTKPRLRIGLLVDSFIQPRWVYRIVQDIQTSSAAEVSLIVMNQRTDLDGGTTFKQRIWANRNHLLYSVYTKLDNHLSKVRIDAFEQTSIEELVPDCPALNVQSIAKGFTDSLRKEDVEKILAHRLDVALRFGFRILKGDFLRIARYGVWSYHHGDSLVNRGSPPAFWEVMNDEPITGSMLQILTEELDNGKVIYRSWAPTVNRFSVKKNNNNNHWKSSAFVIRKLKELHEGDEKCLTCSCQAPYRPYYKRLYKPPTNSEMVPLIRKFTGRAASRAVEKLTSFGQWSLAYRIRSKISDTNDAFYKFKYLIPPKDRFWADPFPVKFGNRYFVFFEDYVYKINKAHISVVELGKDGVLSKPIPVLEKQHHLSYPFIFIWQGHHYMIPETGANRTVELYRCTSFPFRWELERVLLQNINHPVDATLIEVNGLWWMFVNLEVPGMVNNSDELHLYYAESPLGPWMPHRRNPVKSDARSARPAGRLFYHNGALYRPSQDCSKRYGYAITINEVSHISLGDYQEQEITKILPEWSDKVLATHTINTVDDLTVIDCELRRSKFL